MGGGQAVDDGEPETRSARFAVAGRVGAIERLEEARQVVGIDSRAVVVDDELDGVERLARELRFGVLQAAVGEEVVDQGVEEGRLVSRACDVYFDEGKLGRRGPDGATVCAPADKPASGETESAKVRRVRAAKG